MRLKTRLTLLFLIVAWAPLGVAGWLMTERMEERFAAEFQAQSEAVKAAVGERFGQLAEELQLTLDRMASDPLLETELLQPLKHGHFYGDIKRQRAMVREARRLITSPTLDTLRIVDTERDGHVIALGHRRGEEERDAVTVSALRRGKVGAVLLRTERVDRPQSGATEELWTLQVVRRVGDRLALVGGKILSGELLDSLVRTAAGQAHVALELSGKRVVAFSGTARPQRFFDSLRALGCTMASAPCALPDHAPISEQAIRALRREASKYEAVLATTSKDARRTIRIHFAGRLFDDLQVTARSCASFSDVQE